MKPRELLTREFLEEQYVKLGKGSRTITVEQGLKSPGSVKYALKKYGIRNRKRTGVGEITKTVLCRIRGPAGSRNIKFDVTAEYLWNLFLRQKKRCSLSGVPLEFAPLATKEGKRQQTASLDRKDSSKGYVVGNVQWVHKDLNTMKMDLKNKEFIEWCRKIVTFQDEKRGA